MVRLAGSVTVLVLLLSACSAAEPVADTGDSPAVVEPQPVPVAERSRTVSADLTEALERLEAALQDAGHPLADPSVRPVGRSAEDTQGAAALLLGKPVPAELVELWQWWGSSDFGDPALLNNWPSHGLPGGFEFLSLEDAVEIRDRLFNFEMTADEVEPWLAVGRRGEPTIAWFDIDACDNGLVPVTVNYVLHLPNESPDWRFGSIAEFIDAMTDLINNGLWVRSEEPGRGWDYIGEPGEVPWASPSDPLPSGGGGSSCERVPIDLHVEPLPNRDTEL